MNIDKLLRQKQGNGYSSRMPKSATAVRPVRSDLHVTSARSLNDVDVQAWDDLVPRDSPHLRAGFLRAVEDSGIVEGTLYLCAWHGERLVGVAFAYSMGVDILTLMPKKQTRWISAIRDKFAPKMLILPSTVCGPIVTNCNNNFHTAEDLTVVEREDVMQSLLRSMEDNMPGSLLAFFEFNASSAELYEPAMYKRGFIRALSLPGTYIDVHWSNLDEYVASMRKAFRRAVVKDLNSAESISFEVVSDFSEIAEEAWRLYSNVAEKAEYVFENLTPEFFSHLAKFEQSRLITARDKTTGRLIGVELLLAGDTVLQDLYTGLDYSYDPKERLYFNLIYPVIDLAGRQGARRLSLGQTAYTFKARLGAKPYPLFIFLKHRNKVLHKLIDALKGVLFPQTQAITYRVFRDEDGKG